MTSKDEIKQMIKDAHSATEKPESEFHEAARKIVNIERQMFYGGESANKRLKKIREIIADGVSKRGSNEA